MGTVYRSMITYFYLNICTKLEDFVAGSVPQVLHLFFTFCGQVDFCLSFHLTLNLPWKQSLIYVFWETFFSHSAVLDITALSTLSTHQILTPSLFHRTEGRTGARRITSLSLSSCVLLPSCTQSPARALLFVLPQVAVLQTYNDFLSLLP